MDVWIKSLVHEVDSMVILSLNPWVGSTKKKSKQEGIPLDV